MSKSVEYSSIHDCILAVQKGDVCMACFLPASLYVTNRRISILWHITLNVHQGKSIKPDKLAAKSDKGDGHTLFLLMKKLCLHVPTGRSYS